MIRQSDYDGNISASFDAASTEGDQETFLKSLARIQDRQKLQTENIPNNTPLINSDNLSENDQKSETTNRKNLTNS
jgi:hypothetical protein